MPRCKSEATSARSSTRFPKPPRPDISDHIFPNNRERSARPAELQAYCSNPFEAHPLRPSPNQAAPERTYRASSGAPSGTELNRGKIQRPPPRGQPLGAFPHIRQPLGTRKQSPDESKRRNSHRSRRPQAELPIINAAQLSAAAIRSILTPLRGRDFSSQIGRSTESSSLPSPPRPTDPPTSRRRRHRRSTAAN